jgi:hypothetical protein
VKKTKRDYIKGRREYMFTSVILAVSGLPFVIFFLDFSSVI